MSEKKNSSKRLERQENFISGEPTTYPIENCKPKYNEKSKTLLSVIIRVTQM